MELWNDPLFWPMLRQTLANSSLSSTRAYIQHGSTSCYLHSVAVAWYSLRIARALRLHARERELVRGALLHDYFLYDWHVRDAHHRWHGFHHPATALRNASREFTLTARERDIIRRHMFPLTLVPPRCRESALVCLVDKGCSLYETFHGRYPALRGAAERAARG